MFETDKKQNRRFIDVAGNPYYFCILMLFFVLSSGLSKGEERQLVLNDKNYSNISVAPFMARIRDPKSDLTTRKVMEIYDKDGAKFGIDTTSKVNFGIDGSPSWFIINIRNDSKESDFVFSLTQDLFHTQGSIERAILYGANDSREMSVELYSPYFRFDIPRNSDALLLLYIDPADYIPLVLTPHISNESSFFIMQDSLKDGFRAALFLCLGIGLGGYLFFIFKSARNIPYLFAYVLFAVFLISSKVPLLNPNIEIMYPALFLILLISIAVGTLVQYSVSFKDKNEILSVGIPFFLSLVALIIVSILPNGFGLMGVILIFIPTILVCLSFLVLSLAFLQDGYKSAIWTAFSWLFIGLSIILFMVGGFDVYTNLQIMPISLPYVLLSASILFLWISMVTKYSETSKTQVSDFTAFPLSLKNLKEAEEDGEYNRLLTVVERERQMMGELRQIDTRRRRDMQHAKESADEANRAKSAFLAVVSHEIRTPMTGIMGLVRLLMDTPLTTEQQKYAKSIMESGESMTLLLNDILDFEKIETGKMSLEDIFFDIKNVVQSTATLMAGHAQNKNIYLSVEVDADVPLEIKGDPSRIRQVLLNLVGNAIKFTEQGGVVVRLTKSNRLKEPDNAAEDLYPFAIKIEDTGIGISEDAIENLFNPFSQADGTISGKYGGSGLGLAICQRLVELMGGEISVKSEPGKGSVFSIHLLVASKEVRAEARAHEKIDYTKVKSEDASVIEKAVEENSEFVSSHLSQNDGSVEGFIENDNAKKILVVEDNLVSQQVIETFLKKQGHNVTACSNAEDALIISDGAEFDIVFMDWELPGISGPEAIQKIKSNKSLYIKYAILLTGHRVSIEETGLTQDQLSGIINKPVMPEDLETMISQLEETVDIKPIETSLPEKETLKQETVERERIVKKEKSEDQSKPWNYKSGLKNERPPILDQLDKMRDQEENKLEKNIEDLSDENELVQNVWERNIFDRKMINSLLDTLGEPKVRELFSNVIEKTDDILLDLHAAAQDDNFNDINLRAHELKGMAGNFAMLEIHDLADMLEKDIKENAGQNIENLLMKIQKAHLEVKDALQNSV